MKEKMNDKETKPKKKVRKDSKLFKIFPWLILVGLISKIIYIYTTNSIPKFAYCLSVTDKPEDIQKIYVLFWFFVCSLILLGLFGLKVWLDSKKKNRRFTYELKESILSRNVLMILLIIVLFAFLMHILEWYFYGYRHNNDGTGHSIGDSFSITFIGILISLITVITLIHTLKDAKDKASKIIGYDDFYDACIKLFSSTPKNGSFYYSGDTLLPGAYFNDHNNRATSKGKDDYPSERSKKEEDQDIRKQNYYQEFNAFLDRAKEENISVKIILNPSTKEKFIEAGSKILYIKKNDPERSFQNWEEHTKLIGTHNEDGDNRLEIGITFYEDDIMDYLFVANDNQYIIAYPQIFIPLAHSDGSNTYSYNRKGENPSKIDIIGVKSDDVSKRNNYIDRFEKYWKDLLRDELVIENKKSLKIRLKGSELSNKEETNIKLLSDFGSRLSGDFQEWYSEKVKKRKEMVLGIK